MLDELVAQRDMPLLSAVPPLLLRLPSSLCCGRARSPVLPAGQRWPLVREATASAGRALLHRRHLPHSDGTSREAELGIRLSARLEAEELTTARTAIVIAEMLPACGDQ